MKHHGAAPLDPDVSFDFFVERAEHAQEGALSRTAAAQERHELAGPQFERQIRQDGRASKRLFNVETITAESARAARSESASIASECPPPDLPSWHSRGTVHTNGELLTIGRSKSALGYPGCYLPCSAKSTCSSMRKRYPLTHTRSYPKPTSKPVSTASGRSVAAYSVEAHTRDNLLFPIEHPRPSGKLSLRFAP
ncbi:hypothetical protein [Bradyrhizobium sp. NBAIM20]|uniref:hypothetical protein n=1 Tax=Bradyrhizobium sp. NBAIM20 TaxID=2793811 RepID=UPI001CD619A9|nr:hypothetical protein [Bradyrhizobium sp. NBAIM20]